MGREITSLEGRGKAPSQQQQQLQEKKSKKVNKI